MSYGEAMQRAMQGQLDEFAVAAMRNEHDRAERAGHADHLVSIKLNLGVALINLGNRAGLERAYEMYRESEAMFLSAQALQPANELLARNLEAVRNNVRDRQKCLVFNPHALHIGHRSRRPPHIFPRRRSPPAGAWP